MNIVFTVLIATVTFIDLKGVSGQVLRIVGGDEAPPDYGRFHASIQNLTGSHVCGGAVVSKWLVVTAAHCVHGVNPDFMRIVSGTNNLNNGGKEHTVEYTVVYDNYNPITRENDIALLKIRECFDLRYISILKLRRQELKEGDAIFLSGFGAQEPNGLSTCSMQTLNLTVFNQEICEYALRYASTLVTDAMFCTFTRIGEGTCHGDSGSPLVKGSELVGLVSWGIPCAVGFPDVHTRISPFVDWIQEYIEKDHCVAKSPLTILKKLEYIARYTANVPVELKRLIRRENFLQ